MKHQEGLHTDHRRSLLKGSGINPDIVKARGYRTVTVKAELHRLGFSERQVRVPALLMPIWGVNKEVVGHQSRPDIPRSLNGKSIKYEMPSGLKMVLDAHPFGHGKLSDPGVPLFVTEGIKKGDALASQGGCAIALLGVWNWRGTNGLGGKTAPPDWEGIALNQRKVYIVFDSDVMLKREVHTALARLKSFLESRGADVFVVYLPPGPGGTKQGVDDFFATGHTLESLLTFAVADPRKYSVEDTEKDGLHLPYRATDGGLIWDKPTQDGTLAVPLTNFVARIVADIVEDDGVETRRLFEIQALISDKTSRFTIPAQQFSNMSWPAEHLGASAILSPGQSIKDHTRAAIQVLSGRVEERASYTHLGWREIDGQWVYLHAGGAIGPILGSDYESPPGKSGHQNEDKEACSKLENGVPGPIGPIYIGVKASLSGPLGAYILPQPPQGHDLVLAIRASLRQLEVAPDVVSIPLQIAPYRAVLGGVDFSLHLTGGTGFGKSELAALPQQHFGIAFTSRNLPAAWSSTDNALEAMAFIAKDALLVIDDFAPGGTSFEVQQMHRKADRVFRAQGNLSSRQRLRADASLRPAKPPRGLILSTGEDVPKGQSLRARILVCGVGPDDVDWEKLSRCQRDAAEGLYAQALAGFIEWLAPRYGEVNEKLRSEIVDLRQKALASASHRRTPEVMASLAAGLKYLIDYSVDVGALSPEEGRALWERGWKALGEAASRQSQFQAGSEPTKRFRDLLTASIASGRAHVAGVDGESPCNAQAWGWRQSYMGSGDFAREEWQPQGRCVGWIEGDNLYLEPEASYAAAQGIGKETDDPLVVTPKTLHKRLFDLGLLKSTDKTNGHLAVRRTVQGTRRRVLHLASTILEKSDQSGHFTWGRKNKRM